MSYRRLSFVWSTDARSFEGSRIMMVLQEMSGVREQNLGEFSKVVSGVCLPRNRFALSDLFAVESLFDASERNPGANGKQDPYPLRM